MSNNPTRATAPIVSRVLDAYRDENGFGLGKSQVRRGRYGMEEIGGYKVTQRSAGVVNVRWVAPDEMAEAKIPEVRELFLSLYEDVLKARGYAVDRQTFGFGLFVWVAA